MNSKKVLLVSLIVSCILVVLGALFLSEAYELHSKYQTISKMPHIPYDAYVRWIKPFLERYRWLFPVYLIGGSALVVSGVTASFLAVRNRGKKE